MSREVSTTPWSRHVGWWPSKTLTVLARPRGRFGSAMSGLLRCGAQSSRISSRMRRCPAPTPRLELDKSDNLRGRVNSESLFGHRASRFVARSENLASEAFAWIISGSPTGAQAGSPVTDRSGSPVAERLFRVVAVELGMAEPGSPLALKTQSGGAGGSAIPDLVGVDESRGTPLIIETKFWAAPTPNQPGT